MEAQRPGPGEELNLGQESVPRPAATVILLRGGADALEVLLVKRNPQSRFMGGAWVFPGGAVDRGEGEGQDALRAAALREVEEEAGIQISGPDELIPFSRWITPAQVKIRFDTWFYLAALPAGASREGRTDARWSTHAGMSPGRRLRMPAPASCCSCSRRSSTSSSSRALSSAQALIAHARDRDVRPVQPRVVMHGETARIVLPGEPGYED